MMKMIMLIAAAMALSGCSTEKTTTPDWAAKKGGSVPVTGMEKIAPLSREQWSKLRHGMSPSEVRHILGGPESTEKFSSGAFNWHYPDGGIVWFNQHACVEDWKSP